MVARNDEIHSTERLLELIRTKGHQNPDTDVQTIQAPGRQNVKPAKISTPIAFQKKVSIGLDIGHTYLKLAKIQQSSDGFELLDYLDVPLKAPVSFKDSKFRGILKASLDKFCTNQTKYQIWSAIPSAEVEIRCLTIPKVPRKQVANAVFWTFTKKVAFNQSKEMLDYEILGDITEDGVKKTEVIAFKAPREDITQLKDAFREIGYPLNGITIVPFAIQNLLRTRITSSREQNVCSLFVGRDWSRIAIYNNGNLILSRGIKAGMRSMVESINIAMHQRQGWKQAAAGDEVDLGDESHATTVDPAAQKLFIDFLQNADPSQSVPEDKAAANSKLVFNMLLPAIERLVRQIERTLDHYALNFHREKVRRIFISGQITANRRLVDYIGQQLDLPFEVLDPFPTPSPFTDRVKIPASAYQRESYAPAIGIALSKNSLTPNFLFTHQNKNEVENVRKNNMRVLTACMLCLIVMIGYFSWQERQLDIKRNQIEKLNNQLLAYNPPAKKELILALYAQTKTKRRTLNQVTGRYAPVAALNELAQITPASIRLLTIDLAFDAKSGNGRQLVLEGIIFSDPNGFETALTSYLYSLRNSPLFRKPNVVSKRTEYYNAQEVLWFSARLELVG